MSALGIIGQDDFGVGMLRGIAPDVQPGVGLFSSVNGLFNDDGDVYRRGGTTYYSATATAEPLTFIWTGFLAGVPKILLATAAHFYTLDAGQNPVLLGSPGLAGPVQPAVVADKVYLPNGTFWDGGAAMADWVLPAGLPPGEPHVAACAGRLVVARGNRVAFSAPENPATFDPTDFHVLPGGVLVMGMAGLRDTLCVFSNYGLWTISNLAYNLTDAAGNVQQTLSLLTPELALWHESGITEWSGVLIVPGIHRILIVDGVSQPVVISDSIASYYMTFVRAGSRPGGAKVFRNHYFLPILNAAGEVETLLVCRLNRPVRARLTYYPWATFDGFAKGMTAADVDLRDRAPRFLAAHRSGRVVNYTDVYNPSELRASDADGSAYVFDVETRDFPTGQGQPNHVRELRLRYSIEGAADLTAAYSVGDQGQSYQDVIDSDQTYADVLASYASYDAFLAGPDWPVLPRAEGDRAKRLWESLGDKALAEPALDPMLWRFQHAERARYVRIRLRCEDPVAQLIYHRVELRVRAAAHVR